MKQFVKKTVPALLVTAGLFAIGCGVRSGLESISKANRQVSVRGLAERLVDADKVTWPIVYSIVGNDLQALYSQISSNNDIIIRYLKEGGIPTDEIYVTAPEINDRYTNMYGSDRPANRYIAKSVIVVSSHKVDAVNNLINGTASLIRQGIALDANDYSNSTVYEFTGLNEIKPEMIAEATQNAREAADKFAADSDSHLGKIITASQGSFSISDRDNYTPYIKNVRVVTSITYALDD